MHEEMTQEQFVQQFEETLQTMLEIVKRKNKDYSKGGAFGNFELVEKIGLGTAEQGILIRMCDKLSRVSTLLNQENQVKDEAIEDTLLDMANYSIILALLIKHRRGKTD